MVATRAGSAGPITPIQDSLSRMATAWLALSALWTIALRPAAPPASGLSRTTAAPGAAAPSDRQRQAEWKARVDRAVGCYPAHHRAQRRLVVGSREMALPDQCTRAVVDGEIGAQPRRGGLGEDDDQSGGSQGHGHRQHRSIHRPS